MPFYGILYNFYTRRTAVDLDDLRKKIDELDKKIVENLNARAKIVQEIGNLKRKSQSHVYVPGRETQVYQKILKLSKGPLPPKTLTAVYREIMSGSLALEKPLTVAYLGPEASFSHIAATNKFGESLEYLPFSDIPSVFRAVVKKRVDYGIVPIENSTEGGVNDAIDMFHSTNAKIMAEVYQHIQHNLLSKHKQKEITKVYSKLTVFGQCKSWLAENLPDAERIETVSTTRAAEIATEEKNCAAIASSLSAEKYGLPVLYSSIEDNEQNVTRFFILTADIPPKSKAGEYKTSIMISLKDHIGALHDMLIPFKTYNINLTRIESRPSRQKAWEYFFFIDFEGYSGDDNPRECLKSLAEHAKDVKVLGSYPKAEMIF